MADEASRAAIARAARYGASLAASSGPNPYAGFATPQARILAEAFDRGRRAAKGHLDGDLELTPPVTLTPAQAGSIAALLARMATPVNRT